MLRPAERTVAPPDAGVGTFTAVADYLRPLQPLLAGEITELVVNRPGEAWTEDRGGWRRHALPALGFEHLRMLGRVIATATQQGLSESHPLLAAALPGGERIQVVIPPAVPAGTVSLTIRRPSPLRLGLADYEAAGAFDHVAAAEAVLPIEAELLALRAAGRIREFLARAVTGRQNIVVSGATGAGKTTIMKALVDLIPAHERLITIEDTPELDIVHQPNHVRLFYAKDGQGVSRATPKMLLEAGLRMKGDRYLLAELRGDEAFHFLRNVNSGHPGSLTSVHATSPLLAFEQLMLLLKESPGGAQLARADLRALLFMLVDVVVQFAVVDGVRRVTGLYYDPARKRAALG
jgi:type IV secretion system protein VirB11